jgi:hypothetical protein
MINEHIKKKNGYTNNNSDVSDVLSSLLNSINQEHLTSLSYDISYTTPNDINDINDINDMNIETEKETEKDIYTGNNTYERYLMKNEELKEEKNVHDI